MTECSGVASEPLQPADPAAADEPAVDELVEVFG